MGCDIHMFVESKTNAGWVSADTWSEDDNGLYVHPENRIYNGRWYVLFGFLAQVRSHHAHGLPVLGFPSDACVEVREEYDSEFHHSANYVTLYELNTAINRLENLDWSDDGEYLIQILLNWSEKLTRIDTDPQNTRLVFWFDN